MVELFLLAVAQFLSRVCLRGKADLFFCWNDSGLNRTLMANPPIEKMIVKPAAELGREM